MSGLVMKYFVLNPNKNDVFGVAARAALKTYANTICKEDPELTKDLLHWVYKIERRLNEAI